MQLREFPFTRQAHHHPSTPLSPRAPERREWEASESIVRRAAAQLSLTASAYVQAAGEEFEQLLEQDQGQAEAGDAEPVLL